WPSPASMSPQRTAVMLLPDVSRAADGVTIAMFINPVRTFGNRPRCRTVPECRNSDRPPGSIAIVWTRRLREAIYGWRTRGWNILYMDLLKTRNMEGNRLTSTPSRCRSYFDSRISNPPLDDC